MQKPHSPLSGFWSYTLWFWLAYQASAYGAMFGFCARVSISLGMWAHEQETASVANGWVGDPYNTALYKTTVLGGGFDRKVGRVRYSGDGNWIAGEFTDGSFGVWDLQKRSEQIIKIPGYQIYSFDFSPDGKRVLLRLSETANPHDSKNTGFQIWDLEAGRAVSEVIEVSGRQNNAFFIGHWILVFSEGSTRILDGTTYQDTARTLAKDLNIITWDGDYVLGVSENGITSVTNLRTGKELAQIDIGVRPRGILSAERGIVVLDHRSQSRIPFLRDLQTLNPLPIRLEETNIPLDAETNYKTLSPNGRVLYAQYFQGKNKFGIFWDTTTGRQIRRVPNAGIQPEFTKDGQTVAVEVTTNLDGIRSQRTVYFTLDGRVDDYMAGDQGRFIGNVLITSVMDTQNNITHYNFKDLTTGDVAALGSEGHTLEFAPDGSTFFYRDEAIRLFEISPRVRQILRHR